MSWLRRASFALVLTGVAAACTLIDPLDDISGGQPKGSSANKDGASSSSSSGAAADDDDATSGAATSSSGSSGFACSGQKEQEPNDAVGQGTLLSATGVNFCGTLKGGAADVDRWRFTNTTGRELQIVVTVDAQSDLELSVQSGSSQTTGGPGGTNISNLGVGETLTITLTAPASATQDIGYHLVFAVN